MTEKEINYEKLLKVIKDVHSQKVDDVCWMDIDLIFKAAGLPIPDRSVGDKDAMLKNCKVFIETMCSKGNWESYEKVKKERDELRDKLNMYERAELEALLKWVD